MSEEKELEQVLDFIKNKGWKYDDILKKALNDISDVSVEKSNAFIDKNYDVYKELADM